MRADSHLSQGAYSSNIGNNPNSILIAGVLGDGNAPADKKESQTIDI